MEAVLGIGPSDPRRRDEPAGTMVTPVSRRRPWKLAVAAAAPELLDLIRGQRPWASATAILQTVLGPRLVRATVFPAGEMETLRARLTDQHVALLTYTDTSVTADVQLMCPYQSKGREATATIEVLRAGDYCGREPEPMPHGSKLLCVVFTRARRKTVIMTLGSRLPVLVAPLVALSSP